jgi:hypothetical protein
MKVAALVLATAISALSQESVSTNKVVTSTNVAVAAAQNFAPVAAESGPSAGTHAAALQAMFGERTNPIALPKVIAGSTISAAEVLRKALDAGERWRLPGFFPFAPKARLISITPCSRFRPSNTLPKGRINIG